MILPILLTMCGLASSASSVEAEGLRSDVLYWMESIHSFVGSYDYHLEAKVNHIGYTDETYTYKFSDENFLVINKTLQNEGRGDQRKGDKLWVSRWQGDVTVMFDNRWGITVERHRKDTYIPAHVLSPKVIVGLAPTSRAFQDILRRDDIYAVNARDGKRVLWEVPHPSDKQCESLDITVDDQNRIAKIDIVSKPRCSVEDIAALTDADPSLVRDLLYTYEFSDYVEISGTYFPAVVKMTQWGYSNDPELGVIRGQYSRNEITKNQLDVWLMLKAKYKEDYIETVKFNPKSIRINPTLTQEDLTFSIPAKSVTVDHDTGVISDPPWLARNSDRILIGVMMGLLLVGTGVTWRYFHQR